MDWVAAACILRALIRLLLPLLVVGLGVLILYASAQIFARINRHMHTGHPSDAGLTFEDFRADMRAFPWWSRIFFVALAGGAIAAVGLCWLLWELVTW